MMIGIPIATVVNAAASATTTPFIGRRSQPLTDPPGNTPR
jgi:hypothetical protein